MTNQQVNTSGTGLLARLATAYGVDKDKLVNSLKKVAFRDQDVSEEEMLALCVVCEQYGLNPFLKQIFAFKAKDGGYVPIVGIDGWMTIINRQSSYDGMEVAFAPNTVKVRGKITLRKDGIPKGEKSFEIEVPEFCQVTIYRKDLAHPIRIAEYATEVVQLNNMWEKYPRRMLRHKAIIQCARVAFGIGGIYDEDEARCFEPQVATDVPSKASTVITYEREQLDKLLADGVKTAERRGSFEPVIAWAKATFSGENLQYALEYLDRARVAIAPKPEPEDLTPVEAVAVPLPEIDDSDASQYF